MILRVEFDLVHSGNNLGFLEKALKEFDGEVGDT